MTPELFEIFTFASFRFSQNWILIDKLNENTMENTTRTQL